MSDYEPQSRSVLPRGKARTLPQALAYKWRQITPRTVEDRNILYVTLDGIALGFTTAASTFLSVFVIRLGASAVWVSLLTSLPALVNLFVAMPMARFLERQRRIVPVFAWSRLLAHSAYVITGLVPFFLQGRIAGEAIVIVWGLVAVLASLANLGFTLVMSRAVSRERRAVQMSSRWVAMGLSKMVVVALAGQVLARLPFPLNYQVVFIASYGADLAAFCFISRVQNPEQEPTSPRISVRQPFWGRFRAGVAEVLQARAFVAFSLARNVFVFGIDMMAPLIPIYWVQNLGASDAQVSYFNTAITAATLVGYGFWVRVKRRRGNRAVLLAAVFGRSLYPLLIALTRSPLVMIAVAAFNGLAFAGENLMFFDAFLDTVPKGREARFVAINQTLANAIAFVSPPLGAALLPVLGIQRVLMLAAVIAFTGFLLFFAGGIARETSLAAISPW